MDERGELARRFEADRGRLRAVAYRMLGSLSEAEDAVQEAWLRLERSDAGAIDNVSGWLTTVVGRVCLDMLRARKTRREEPLGVHLPDPCDRLRRRSGGGCVARRLGGLALLVVLDTLSSGGAARVCSARHVRRAVRRGRDDRGAFARRHQDAREPCPSAGAGRRAGARCRSHPAAPGRRRVSRCCSRW